MENSSPSPLLRFLLGAACAVIVMWGIRAAASILGPLLLGLLVAYAVVPFPEWLMKRFKLSKSAAIAIMAAAAVGFTIYIVFALDLASLRIAERLPIYAQRLTSLYQQITVFATAHGIAAPVLSVESVMTPERVRQATQIVLPVAAAIISRGVLISLLAFLFVTEMVEDSNATQSPINERLHRYASDARSYVIITARSAGINALANLAFLLVMRVDTPIVWCSLYFFLDFIPTVGYLIALLPPTLVTLLMYGWKRALLVAGGLLLTNLIVDNVVTPIFMEDAVNVSFLEITLSLLGWTFLLGLAGTIVAIPLTLALKKSLDQLSQAGDVASAPSG